MTRPPGESRWNAPRILFVAGVLVAIAAVVSWVVSSSSGGSGPGGACRVPAHASAGTEPMPALVATVATPIGAPDAAFTQRSAGVTVYGLCYDVVDGSAVASAVATLRAQPYDVAPGSNPTQQLNFTGAGLRPYGVSLSVGGTLDVSHPVAGTQGSLSIVWTDQPLPPG